MKTSEVLTKAADAVEREGWRTGHGGWGGEGGLCLEGAIAAAAGIEWGVNVETGKPLPPIFAVNRCPAGQAVREYLGLGALDSHPTTGNALWRWNDAPHRNAIEVIATLRAAAVIEAAREQQPTDSFHRSLDRALAAS
jgi:hypothetical protein